MPKKSAGIIAFKFVDAKPSFLLVHPGGPFFQKKDAGVWSIPKGEFEDDEDPLLAAKREFNEETGGRVDGAFIELQPVKIKSGKVIYSWAVEADFEVDNITSNSFEMEWPPKSGRVQSFPEVDRAGWFDFDRASVKINQGQLPILNELMNKLKLKSRPYP